MVRLNRNRVALSAVAVLVGLALLAGACGSDGEDGDRTPTEQPTTVADAGGSVPSIGSVAPNTFLTFEGQQYRLERFEQADLVAASEFTEIGLATDADIDQEDLTVYARAGDSDAVYTYAKPRASVDTSAIEDTSTPALWYRWVAEA